jgi:superfamily I DNA/RNA helicase
MPGEATPSPDEETTREHDGEKRRSWYWASLGLSNPGGESTGNLLRLMEEGEKRLHALVDGELFSREMEVRLRAFAHQFRAWAATHGRRDQEELARQVLERVPGIDYSWQDEAGAPPITEEDERNLQRLLGCGDQLLAEEDTEVALRLLNLTKRFRSWAATKGRISLQLMGFVDPVDRSEEIE